MCSSADQYTYYLNNSNATYVAVQDICSVVLAVEEALQQYLLHLMIVPVVVLILITLLGKENEDAKWFVFHTACLNLILGIVWEVSYACQSCDGFYIVLLVTDSSLNLAVFSIFPLAFTKFLYLYFPNVYNRIFYKKYFIAIFLAVFDSIFTVFLFIIYQFSLSICCLVATAVIFLGTLTCAILIFIRLRKLMQMVDSHSKLSTYSDLRRAGFICIFQTCLISLHLVARFYTDLFSVVLVNAIIDDSFYFYMNLYNILYEFQYTIYQLFVIVDTSVTLLVLRSYRNAFRKIFWRAVRVIYQEKVTKTGMNRTQVTFVNNFTTR